MLEKITNDLFSLKMGISVNNGLFPALSTTPLKNPTKVKPIEIDASQNDMKAMPISVLWESTSSPGSKVKLDA